MSVAMHNTRLFPKGLGPGAYRLTGIAARCDWALMTDRIGEPELRGDSSIQPRTVFVSNRSAHDALPYFYFEVLPRIEGNFVLVSGSEDFTVPKQVDARWRANTDAEKQILRTISEDPRLIHWFVENRDEVLPNTSSLPVGYVFDEGQSNLTTIEPGTTQLVDRPLSMLCTHMVRVGPQWDIRREVTELCRDHYSDSTTIVDREVSPREFLTLVRQHPFAVCVQGGGLDPSPKAWACIANGTIPIIKSSSLDDAYRQLPVAIIEDWNADAMTPARLSEWLEVLGPFYEDSALRAQVLYRLSLDFWWSKIIGSFEQFHA